MNLVQKEIRESKMAAESERELTASLQGLYVSPVFKELEEGEEGLSEFLSHFELAAIHDPCAMRLNDFPHTREFRCKNGSQQADASPKPSSKDSSGDAAGGNSSSCPPRFAAVDSAEEQREAQREHKTQTAVDEEATALEQKQQEFGGEENQLFKTRFLGDVLGAASVPDVGGILQQWRRSLDGGDWSSGLPLPPSFLAHLASFETAPEDAAGAHMPATSSWASAPENAPPSLAGEDAAASGTRIPSLRCGWAELRRLQQRRDPFTGLPFALSREPANEPAGHAARAAAKFFWCTDRQRGERRPRCFCGCISRRRLRLRRLSLVWQRCFVFKRTLRLVQSLSGVAKSSEFRLFGFSAISTFCIDCHRARSSWDRTAAVFCKRRFVPTRRFHPFTFTRE